MHVHTPLHECYNDFSNLEFMTDPAAVYANVPINEDGTITPTDHNEGDSPWVWDCGGSHRLVSSNRVSLTALCQRSKVTTGFLRNTLKRYCSHGCGCMV